MLHIGFLWLPVGFALMALAPVLGFPASAALHALTGGAMATMMLGVSTRATRGHTGRALQADGLTVGIYALVTIAAAARVIAGMAGAAYMPLLTIAGLAWTGAFALILPSTARCCSPPARGGEAAGRPARARQDGRVRAGRVAREVHPGVMRSAQVRASQVSVSGRSLWRR